MSDDKIKIRDIEGSSEEVINFFKKTDLDIGDYMNSAKNIKIPFCAIVIASILFVVLLCIITVLDDDVKIKKILVIISVAVAFVNTAFAKQRLTDYAQRHGISLQEAVNRIFESI